MVPYDILLRAAYDIGFPCRCIPNLDDQREYAGSVIGYRSGKVCAFDQDGTAHSLRYVGRSLSNDTPLINKVCYDGAVALSESIIESLVRDIMEGKWRSKEVFVEGLYFDIHPKGGRAMSFLKNLCNEKGLQLHVMQGTIEDMHTELY